MVHLTMTPSILAAIEYASTNYNQEYSQLEQSPSLLNTAVGNPIAHSQLLALSKILKPAASPSYRLQSLLRGSAIHTPPPASPLPKSPSYIALMARLRAEAEQQSYERMIDPSLSPPPPTLQFPNAYPTASTAAALEADEVTYADINRQLALIFNVLVSIIACSVAIWMAASHWSAPTRLGLSMTGSAVVAVAEVVIYSGYIRRVTEAKTKERKKVERKSVVKSWRISGKKEDIGLVEPVALRQEEKDDGIRLRKGKAIP